MNGYRVAFAHVEQTKDAAEQAREDYHEDRRNPNRVWKVKIFPRTVKAGRAEIPCWAVVVYVPEGQAIP